MKTLSNIFKAIILLPSAIFGYIIIMLFSIILIWIMENLSPFSDIPLSFSQLQTFLSSSGFNGLSYFKGVWYLLIIRFFSTLGLFYFPAKLFPNNRILVFSIICGLLTLFIIACITIIFFINPSNNFDVQIRTFIESVIMIGAMYYEYLQLKKIPKEVFCIK